MLLLKLSANVQPSCAGIWARDALGIFWMHMLLATVSLHCLKRLDQRLWEASNCTAHSIKPGSAY